VGCKGGEEIESRFVQSGAVRRKYSAPFGCAAIFSWPLVSLACLRASLSLTADYIDNFGAT